MPPHSPAAADWDAWRAEMPVAESWAYFDHAAVAPLSAPAQAQMRAWIDDSAEVGDVHWLRWSQEVEQTRRSAAALLNAESAELALVPNTTAGIQLVAEGYPWQVGDNVVLPADEFPSNQYPWLNLRDRGVEVRRIEPLDGYVSPDRILAAVDARTRIVALSWVNFAHGYRYDLDMLAAEVHRRGAWIFVDAIQGLGVFPLDVRTTPIDALAADGHKWLLGPEGAGVFYLRAEHLDRLRPLGVGWNSVRHGADFSRIEPVWKASAARYEGGTCNTPGMLGLGASIDLLAQYGTVAISERVLSLAAEARERLKSLGAEIVVPGGAADLPRHGSGIVSFTLPGEESAAVRERCLDHGVVLSCRAGRLRLSPHGYNTTADFERLEAALRSSQSGRSS